MKKGSSEVISDKMCLLYKANGRIVHFHRETTVQGGSVAMDDEVEANAKKHASMAGHDVNNLGVLLVNAENYDESAVYRVDVEKKELIKEMRQPLQGFVHETEN